MKIGEIARTYGVEVSTVRYYIKCGLLVPQVFHKQYRFDRRCETDMNIIIQLKEYGFSIDEIRSALSVIHLSNLTAQDDLTDFIAMLETKEGELKKELDRIRRTHGDLKEFIHSLKIRKKQVVESPKKRGLPLAMLPLLCCPHCGTPLELAGADIKDGEVFRGQASCPCGYSADIVDGIVFAHGGKLAPNDNPDLKRNLYKKLPLAWFSLYQHSFNRMNEWLGSTLKPGMVVLESHVNCFSFLFSRLDELDRDACYIMTDPHPEIVRRFKNMIEQQNPGLTFLYLVDKTCDYPIKKASVDIYIDTCSLNEHANYNKDQDLISALRPYLKPEAALIGTYLYFHAQSPSYRSYLLKYPNCAKSNYQLTYFQSLARRLGIRRISEADIGSTDEWCGENPYFSFHISGDPVHFRAFYDRLP